MDMRQIFDDLHQQEPPNVIRDHFFAVVDELDVRQVVLGAIILYGDEVAPVVPYRFFGSCELSLHLRLVHVLIS